MSLKTLPLPNSVQNLFKNPGCALKTLPLPNSVQNSFKTPGRVFENVATAKPDSTNNRAANAGACPAATRGALLDARSARQR
eukprot:364406-Chlamydomonas_euryale.AAC.8